ncbi:MAG TPA: hypothetical protein VNE63_08725 [Candidatus Acidoferrales bacterium]|nr:hypothetical protein [Candidatus Acidoferrales bacterium]
MPEMPRTDKVLNSMRWLPAYLWQRMTRTQSRIGQNHLILALADHFEPSFLPETPGRWAPREVQHRRLEKWCRTYPKIFDAWRDSAGFPFVHTYFYPAEQYDRSLLERLAEHCHAGWGEIEIQLHHGVKVPDTAENMRRQLVEFRDSLASLGCLSRAQGNPEVRYGFVHGNWALANSCRGHFCGVDEEMQILAETGCYADFTLPSAPNSAQVAKINALYECALPLNSSVPHRRGHNLRINAQPNTFPLIFQGPLMFDFGRRALGALSPRIENGALTGANPPSLHRLQLWIEATITVQGRPNWLFVKLHCHGMDPRDESAMVGSAIQRFLGELIGWARENCVMLHFLTAREMVNVALAACDSREGNPSDYRDYRLRLNFRPL